MDKKQFLSLSSVVFLAVLLPGILRQVNKVTRVMAGAEGRLTAINVETDRVMGKLNRPFVFNLNGLSVSPVLNYQKSSEIQNFVNETVASKKLWDFVAIDGQNLSPDEIRTLRSKLDQLFSYRLVFGDTGRLIYITNKSDSYVAAMGSEILNSEMSAYMQSETEVTKLFDKLGSQKLQITGNGSWVFATAAKDRDTYQVIVANYDPKGVHTELVPVNFLNLEVGKFEFRKTFLGSKTTTEAISTDSGTLQKVIPMMANSVVFLELEAK